MTDDTVPLKRAAKWAGIDRRLTDDDVPDEDRPANQPGAESTAHLEAMLAASKRGKTVGRKGR